MIYRPVCRPTQFSITGTWEPKPSLNIFQQLFRRSHRCGITLKMILGGGRDDSQSTKVMARMIFVKYLFNKDSNVVPSHVDSSVFRVVLTGL